jgi:hypothetical protein
MEFGVGTGPIRRVLTENGVRPRLGRGPDKQPRLPRATARASEAFSDQERADVTTRFLAGDTQVALSRKFRCSPTTIGRILRIEGVPAGSHGQLREHHHNWKGGRLEHVSGYVMVRPEPDDGIGQAVKGVSGYVLEHRLVMAHSLGRPLTANETVHHCNGDKLDNRLENLQLRSGRHGRGEAHRCLDCGSHNVAATTL